MRNSLVSRNIGRNPFSFIEDFENDLVRIFGNAPVSRDFGMLPALDMAERDSHYVLSVDLPGVHKEDVSVEVQDNILRIKGERKAEVENADYSERTYGSFERAIKLPREVKTQDIEARFENGVLQLAIPKTLKESAKKIEIKDASKSGFWNKLMGRKSDELAS